MNPESLSLEQLAGQRLMVGFEGKQFNRYLEFLIRDLKVGGVILFSQNVETPGQIKKLCGAVQEFARQSGQPPLIIAIDQEGGQVARLKEPFTQFPGNDAMADVDDAVYFARTTAAELARAGINMNLAPVLDVAPEDISSIMAGRSFGKDPRWVSTLGLTIISHSFIILDAHADNHSKFVWASTTFPTGPAPIRRQTQRQIYRRRAHAARKTPVKRTPSATWRQYRSARRQKAAPPARSGIWY